jgi:hypothetical protein
MENTLQTTQNNLPVAETQTAMMAMQAKALVEARYMMAMARPRDIMDVQQRLQKECKRPSFAEGAIYKKPVGNSAITGLSIRFAEAAARLFGNICTESFVVFEDEVKRIIKVSVSDCETNAVYAQDIIIDKTVERKNSKGREVIRSRTNSFGEIVYIVLATEDEMQNKQGSAISKVIRNQVLRLIPVDILEECKADCLATMNNANAKDPDLAKKKLITAFSEIGISAAELAKYLGHSVESIKPEEITELTTIGRTIKDGETTWKAIMESKNIAEVYDETPQAKSLVEELKEKKNM